MADVGGASSGRDRPDEQTRTGVIAMFARHPNAANLVMALMIVAGIYGILKLNAQFLPEFGIDVVTVSVEWSGASAEDVARTCHAHPTLTEAVKEAALAVDGRALHM